MYGMVLALAIIFSLSFVFVQNFGDMTGYATEATTVSNVTITKYLAISFSTNLSDGIVFGDIAALPATNVNATHNYDNGSSGTSMFINVSTDGNTAVDFCLKSNAALTNAALDTIGLGNETYANHSTTNSSVPDVANEVAFTGSYVKAGENVAVGTVNYYRFWLDVPVAQPSGDYNNTVSFKGVSTTLSC